MTWHRVLRTSKVTITRRVEIDEQLTDANDPLEVSLDRLDGTNVDTGTSTRDSLGTYSFALDAQPDLDLLLMTWTGTVAGAAVSYTDQVEVVGGFLFDLGVARARYRDLRDTTAVPSSRLAEVRTEIEVEFETICGQAFVPRFGRHVTLGRATPYLPVPDTQIRRVRSVSVGGVAWAPAAAQAVFGTRSGYLVRPGGAVWPVGSLVAVEYEHGLTAPPPPVSTAGIMRLRDLVFAGQSGAPARAETIQTPEGSTFRLAVADRDSTGIPEVDGILAKFPAPRREVTA